MASSSSASGSSKVPPPLSPAATPAGDVVAAAALPPAATPAGDVVAAVALPPAATPSGDVVAAAAMSKAPVVSEVEKHHRAYQKKLNRIARIEDKIAEKKTINTDERRLLDSKPIVEAVAKELEHLDKLIPKSKAPVISEDQKEAVLDNIKGSLIIRDEVVPDGEDNMKRPEVTEQDLGLNNTVNDAGKCKLKQAKSDKSVNETEGAETGAANLDVEEMIAHAAREQELTRAKQIEKEQLGIIHQALAVLASSQSVSKEHEEILSIAKKIESILAPSSAQKSGLRLSYSLLVAGSNDNDLCHKLLLFLEEFKLTGCKVPYYLGEANAVPWRLSPDMRSAVMRISYTHLEAYDRDFAMKVFNSRNRLREKFAAVALQYVRNHVKDLDEKTMQTLVLKFVGIPKRKEMLDDYLSRDLTDEKQIYLEKDSVTVASPQLCVMIIGIMKDMFRKHLKGLSWNGEIELQDIEVTNSTQFTITKRPSVYDLGHGSIPVETRNAFAKDLSVIPNVILSKIPGLKAIPHWKVFQKYLKNADLELMSDRTILKEYYALLINNPFVKPPLAVLNLFCGIHRACRSHDAGDLTAPYRKILQESDFEENGFSWKGIVNNCKNDRLKEVLKYPETVRNLPSIINKPLPYEDTLRSFTDYIRHLDNHFMDDTHTKRRIIHAADGPRYDENEPREQQVKLHDEIAIMAGIHLSSAMNEVMLILVKNFVMVGMLETHWKVYQSCCYTIDDDLEDDEVDWF